MHPIISLLNEYLLLNLHEVIDHDRFNQYAIVHHATTIEVSTLTENETRVLLEDGITPKGKPLEHSLMVKDHFDALQFTIEAARNKLPITVEFIQSINARVMKSTAIVFRFVKRNRGGWAVDASFPVCEDTNQGSGVFRKENVSAGGSYFVNYDKVAPYTTLLANKLQAALPVTGTVEEKLELSFLAHFELVSIHPFYDGNGRSSRLLMYFIQEYYRLPLAMVYKEDRSNYFTALQESRKQENINIFYDFMFGEYEKFLSSEIEQYKKDITDGGKGFPLFL